ncbi:MAG: bifunctional 3-deoxy-7-phosphoheptulonate synthase/chorismate mutase type II [Saprospiraceae bacterium]|nr:bifunctional 3-deoxy-7-phosphoheptulonate synthase/chorismate mutase type II [Saprospiraceae bacterium]
MQNNLKIEPLNNWLKDVSHPLIISGPCSAETEEQVLSTAFELSKIPNIRIFRAGIWKPRTRPDKFQGVGIRGLKWLRKVKEKTGLLTAVEVANAAHVKSCLEHSVDVLWIGARTVVNPFSVQEISEVLNGVDIPVMVKNPLNPDKDLWFGALERLNNAGITKLIAVHRGFDVYEKSPYRNLPMWEIPIELKRIYPDIPIICDPSHIAGKRELLFDISQRALDLSMDGLMIETHINPDKALTDAAQQITPKSLNELISKLVIRKQVGDVEFKSNLDELRQLVDQVDEELLKVLARRMKIVEQMGEYKKNHSITILQLDRWREIIKDRLSQANDLNLDSRFILKLLQLVHKESIQKQNDIMNE